MQKYFILSQLHSELSRILDSLAVANAMLTTYMAEKGDDEIIFTREQLIKQGANPVHYLVDGDKYIAMIDRAEEQTDLFDGEE